ncbi:hypothetical protein os4_11880 [Comamonadaceae bacterium OS-4]|nr:hypothetical protein os4_11880 [Comamonadaceae bacterium OS-4]
MNTRELLRWQWEGYTQYHQSRSNLLLHIVVVPLFLLGNVGLVLALINGAVVPALLSLAAMVISMAAQGRGHGMEVVPPMPFSWGRQCNFKQWHKCD